MPEVEPADPMSAIARIEYLPPGSQIRVIQTVLKGSNPWYEVRALSSEGSPLGSGWINSLALIGQLSPEPEMVRKLISEYLEGLAKRYGVTDNELNQIVSEGIEKGWPTP